MTEPQKKNNEGYWLEANETESNRLLIQHRYFTAALGGLLPQAVPADEIYSVLDVGCGPGGWALDLVQKYPHMSVTGIDNAQTAISQATRIAQLNKTRSATFQLMDATRPLAFKNNTFDLVHMRSASPFIRSDMWPTIIAELVRVLRPGGWLVVIDYEQGPTSSEAFNQIGMLAMQAVRAAKLSLAPASTTIGAAVHLYGFLLNAHLVDVAYSVHSVDFGRSKNVDAPNFIEELLIGAANFKPFVTRLGLIDSDAYDALIARAREQLSCPDACGYGFLISSWGRKEG